MTENQKKIVLGVAAIAVVAALFWQWRNINQPASEIDQNTKEIIEYNCKTRPNDPECKK